MSRIVLIGQAPGPKTDPEQPLYPGARTTTGARLAELMGLTPEEYLGAFDRVNLLNTFPKKYKKTGEDKFPLREGKAASRAMAWFLNGRRVVLLGRNVATAFGVTVDYHVWTSCRLNGNDFSVAIVPHPSGRNLYYNVRERRDLSRRFWEFTLDKGVSPTLHSQEVMA